MVERDPLMKRKIMSQPVVLIDKKSQENNCCAPQVQSVSCCSVEKRYPGFVKGTINTPAGPIPRITHRWTREDHIGQIRCRMSSFRMRYIVRPGLYAIGNPSSKSDVIVTANYRLTFNILRRELEGMNLWILVLDTKGINVWCAAGKGTFGTAELAARIKSSSLKNIISHNRIILPQLGAPGVSASEIKRLAGFNVKYGPVRACDIRQYIEEGYTASSVMRTVTFAMTERAVLMPMEYIPALRKSLPAALVILVVAGLYPHGILFMDCIWNGLPMLTALFFAVTGGACLSPVLLPWIPGRSFALKGFLTGIAMALFILYLFPGMPDSPFLLTACLSGVPAVSSYLALQFTGATPFTNMTGVRKEVRLSLPLHIAGIVISALAIIAWKLSVWGIL